jgi:transcription-repair coupling factor (superfamily II helicase)
LPKQRNRDYKDLWRGRLDIVIGVINWSTNAFYKKKDPLIVDEEQKFGVNVKDKLKTITLTWYTHVQPPPQYRTLQFSLVALA